MKSSPILSVLSRSLKSGTDGGGFSVPGDSGGDWMQRAERRHWAMIKSKTGPLCFWHKSGSSIVLPWSGTEVRNSAEKRETMKRIKIQNDEASSTSLFYMTGGASHSDFVEIVSDYWNGRWSNLFAGDISFICPHVFSMAKNWHVTGPLYFT